MSSTFADEVHKEIDPCNSSGQANPETKSSVHPLTSKLKDWQQIKWIPMWESGK